jgi:hypothetical protein
MKTPLITREGYEKLKQELDFSGVKSARKSPKSHLGGKPGRSQRKCRLPVQ